MRFVLDSSVAFKWSVPETDSDKAMRLRTNFLNGAYQLIAPDIFPQELAHALTRAERQGRIPVGLAEVFWDDVLITPPLFHPSLPLTPRAIELSSLLRIGVYDCLYVALAEQERTEFVTADDKLIKNLQGQFPFVISLLTIP